MPFVIGIIDAYTEAMMADKPDEKGQGAGGPQMPAGMPGMM